MSELAETSDCERRTLDSPVQLLHSVTTLELDGKYFTTGTFAHFHTLARVLFIK